MRKQSFAQSCKKYLPKMKSITVLTLFVAVVNGITIPGTSLGHFTSRTAAPIIQPRTTPEQMCLGHPIGQLCGDCTTLLVCLGPGVPPAQTQCKGEKPFCDFSLNVCSARAPADGSCGDSLSDPTFKCSIHDAFFPHPTNCSLFYECVGNLAYRGECGKNEVWTTNGMSCKTKKVTADCGTFNCKSTSNYNKLVPYSANNIYYAFCKAPLNGIQEIIVLKCEQPNYYFQTSLGYCDFECKDVKLYEDVTDPRSYYDCRKDGTKFVYERKTCILNRQFEESSQTCIS